MAQNKQLMNNNLSHKEIKWDDLELSHEIRSQIFLLSQNIHQNKIPLKTAVPKDIMNTVMNAKKGMSLGWWSRSDFFLDAEIYREHPDLYRLKGTLRMDLSHCCGRCLKELDLDFNLDFDLRLAPGESDILGTQTIDLDPQGLKKKMSLEEFEESMLMENDEDFINFARGKINLLQIMREQIFLELPSHPRCESKDFPLSGPCLSDPMQISKKEKAEWVASKWAGLEKLKLKN